MGQEERMGSDAREKRLGSIAEDENKRKDLASKFQTTIDEIAAQLSNYSEKSTSLREQNVQLSEQLAVVVKDYDLREKEVDACLKQKELELRLTEASLEQTRLLLTDRTELIKQERQVSEAERLVLFKKCEELAASELGLRQQVTIYAERYQEFQNAIQQSSQMVTSCHTEIEKMGKKIKKLEKERADFRQRWETAEQNQRKSADDVKQSEKEKRQLENKLDKLEKLSRALQQERTELQNSVKKLAATVPPTMSSSGVSLKGDSDGLQAAPDTNNCQQITSDSPLLSSEIATINVCDVDQHSSVALTINGSGADSDEHNQRKETDDQNQKLPTNDNDDSLLPSSDAAVVVGSPNLYDCEFGQVAKTVD